MRNIFVIAAIVLAFAMCTAKQQPPEEVQPVLSENSVTLTTAQMQNANIATSPLVQRNIAAVIKVNGKVDLPPQNIVSVSATMGGYVKQTSLLPGTKVRKGQVLAVLEDPSYIQLQQDYLLAKSKLYFAQLEYNRQRDLNQSQASSDKVTQQAQAEMNHQRIMMNALAEKLKLININPASLTENNISKSIRLFSSINGSVSKVNVNIGKYVTPSDVLFELIDPSDIHLNLRVFEKDVNKLYIDQPLVAYTNVDPQKKYNCAVHIISSDVNEDGSTDVHCHFLNYSKKLLPGMYMNAEVNVTSASSNTLPVESVVNFEGINYVFVQQGKQTFVLHEVKTGNTENGYVEILDNDLANQTIVTKGAYTLLMKLKNSAEEE